MNYRISLVGNPNVGKTSLYNRITHSFEHVGNWHGVTVAEASKTVRYGGHTVTLIDLPGLYSLSTCSSEEEISRDRILANESDLIVNVCEVNNLSRNLYLTLQLLELEMPVVLVVNMMDELDKRGKKLDCEKLSAILGVPVVPMCAKYRGAEKQLMDTCFDFLARKSRGRASLPYLRKLPIDKLSRSISANIIKAGLPPLWAAVKVLERDRFVTDKLCLTESQTAQIDAYGDTQAIVAQVRYEYIDEITKDLIYSDNAKKRKSHKSADQSSLSGIDKIALDKYLAFPIFLLVMAVIFVVTFGIVGKFLTDLLETGIDKLIYLPLTNKLNSIDCPEWVVGLVGDGVIHGVGSVLVFLPQIVLLFFFLALLEDSGYISRVAFMTDGLFRKIGLSGRSVFTLIMGFGCSATAVLTARGLEDENMRKKTVLLTPFMSCNARLPVYSAIAAAFFSGGSPLIIFSMYVLGIAVAIGLAAIFQRTKKLESGKISFIMEMPPYRFPTAERVFQILRNNIKIFLIRVGTVVFALNVIVWLLSNFSFTAGYVTGSDVKSIMEWLGQLLAPIFSPLGFGNWKAVSALLSGVIAKEAVISSIESLGGVEAIFSGAFPALSAFTFMVFTLLYVPCVATLGAIRKEIGGKAMLFSLALQFAVAYTVALLVHTVGLLFCLWRGIAVGVLIATVILSACIASIAFVHKKKVACGSCHRCAGCTKIAEKEKS